MKKHYLLFALALSFLIPPIFSIDQTSYAQSTDFEEVMSLGRGSTRSSAWSPDGTIVAVGSDNFIWLYTADLTDVAVLETQPSYSVDTLAWSPDGRMLAASTGWPELASSTTFIWETDSWELIAEIPNSGNLNGNSLAYSIQWSPDSTHLAIPTSDTLSIWNVPNEQLTARLTGHTRGINDVAWSSDGTQLASISHDGIANIWDLSSGSLQTTLDVSTDISSSPNLAVIWNPNDTQLAIGVGENIQIWDIATRTLISTETTPNNETIVDLRWNDNQLMVLTTSEVFILETASQQFTSVFGTQPSAFRNFDWQIDSSQIVAVILDNVLILDLKTSQLVASSELHNTSFYSIAWSPNGTQLASVSSRLQIWDTISGDLQTTLEYSDGLIGASIGWSPDGSQLAISGNDGSIHIWDIGTAQVVYNLTTQMTIISSLAWSSVNNQLAAVDRQNNLEIWDISNGQLLMTLRGERVLAWSPDGNHIATVIPSGDMVVWEITTQQIIATFDVNDTQISQLAWSPEGTQIASISRNREVVIWDISTQSPLNVLHHPQAITSIAWSPVENILLSVSASEINVWDIDTGQVLQTIPTIDVRQLAWQPTGERFATAGRDGLIRIYQ
jgi:WD40 repeat protein